MLKENYIINLLRRIILKIKRAIFNLNRKNVQITRNIPILSWIRWECFERKIWLGISFFNKRYHY